MLELSVLVLQSCMVDESFFVVFSFQETEIGRIGTSSQETGLYTLHRITSLIIIVSCVIAKISSIFH
jgi:hypothetical protein